MSETSPHWFPYMHWAHAEGFHSAYCFAQSGVPAPDAALVGEVPGRSLEHPCMDAQPGLEAELARRFGCAPERVIVTPGASAAMLVCAMRLFGPGTRVVTERPSYELLRRLPAFFGAEVLEVNRLLDDEWHLDPARVRSALAPGRGPGHVFVTNAHNPTGAVASEEDVQALAAAAREAGGLLVSCETYMEFAPNDRRVHAFALAPNALSIGSLTKAWGLGGLRVGWIVLGKGLASLRTELLDMAYLAYVDPPTPSLLLARRALERAEVVRAPAVELEARGRPHLRRWLASAPGVRGTLAPFGITAFPRLEGIEDTRTLTAYLASAHDVDVVAGESFGAPGHIRVSCAVPEATLEAGLERLTEGLQAFRAGERPS